MSYIASVASSKGCVRVHLVLLQSLLCFYELSLVLEELVVRVEGAFLYEKLTGTTHKMFHTFEQFNS